MVQGTPAKGGLLPRPDAFRLRPGSHDVEVTLAGHEPFRATVMVPPGESISLDVELTPIAEAPAQPEDEGRSTARPLPIALYASGGGLVVTGAILGGLALAKTSDRPVETTDAADRAHALSLAADVTLGLGIAAGAAGLVVHLLSRPDDGDDDAGRASIELTPFVGPDHVGIGAAGRF